MTIRDFFDNAVNLTPDRVFQHFHEAGEWRTRTFAEAKERVERIVAVMRDLHLPDVTTRPRIALMLENCPDWQLVYLAVAGAGATVVPMDPKLRASEVSHVLEDSGAVCVIASRRLCETITSALGRSSKVLRLYMDEMSNRIAAVTNERLAAAREWYGCHRPASSDLASLIYTSGTTGRPKGAMLTHGNFTANVEQTLKRVSFYDTDNFLNVLPLFHAFSFTGNFLLPLAVKGSVSFIRNLKTIADDMFALSPTILLAVPLLAEKLYQRIDSQIRKSMVASGLFRFGFSRKIVAKKIIERFGGQMRVIGIGGAPTSVETLEGFQKIGLQVLEGYGITECAPGVCYPSLDSYVPGTVGRPLDGIEWKIVDKDDTGAGELWVKGDNITSGYWNNPEGTASAFSEDGFYKTGDIVRLDKHGNVRICGRTKALIVNREGKNIYPEEIEQVLEHAPLVQDVVVVGFHCGNETGEHVGAIVVPNEDAVAAHLKGRKMTREEMTTFISGYVQSICRASLADYKLPRKIEVRFTPLERTSSMKVRRVVYKGALDEA